MRQAQLNLSKVKIHDAVLQVILGRKQSTTVVISRDTDWLVQHEALMELNEMLSDLTNFFLFGKLSQGHVLAEWWFYRKSDGAFILAQLFSSGYMTWLLTEVALDILKPDKEIQILREALEIGVLPYWLLLYNEKLLKEVQV